MILSKNMYQNTKIPEVAILFYIGRGILRSSRPMFNNQKVIFENLFLRER